jgi:hypothetical protein
MRGLPDKETRMRAAPFAGWHVVILVFATTLLSVPLSEALFSPLGWSSEARAMTDRAMPFAIGYLVILLVPGARNWAAALLRRTIAPDQRKEVLAVAAFHSTVVLLAFGGAVALWWWTLGGNEGLARRMGDQQATSIALEQALRPSWIAMQLLLVSTLGPVLEELVFRAWLQRAWERRWGWPIAMLMTAITFGLYHSVFFTAFVSSIVLSCVYRRTGALRSAIAAHMLYNTMLWVPLLGQFVFLRDDAARFDIGAWWLHFLCLGLAVVAITTYACIARATRGGEDRDG